jgi:hypothetical protein
MAGLIEQQMQPGQEPMAEEELLAQDPAMMQDPAMADSMAMEEADDDEDLNEDDPAFQTALQYAMEALYANEAARDVAQTLKAAPDPVQGLAETAYEITSIVDERTDGEVPDELLVLLAINVLQEVAEIGEAAGVDTSPTIVAEAFKQMLLRFLQENGANTAELEQAMADVDPSVFQQAAQAEA